MRSFLRWLCAAIAILLLPPALYLAMAIAGAAFSAAPETGRAPGDGERVYLLTTLLHADIAVPLDEEMRRRYAFLRSDGLPLDHPNARYLIFGWGSKAFYTTARSYSDIRPGPLFQAITGDDTVMHVYVASDVSGLPNAKAVMLPPGGMKRMLRFFDTGFQRFEGRPDRLEGLQYGPADAFYAGTGEFNFLRPCNIWVAEALRAAGLETGRWTPTTHMLLLGLAVHSPEAMDR